MRIVSYNMRQGGSSAHWEAVLRELQPDLMFVQETRDPAVCDSLFFTLPRNRVLWHWAREGKWGSAVLLPSESFSALDVPGYRGWVSGAEITNVSWAGLRPPLRVFSIHVPSGRGSYAREANRILDAIQRIPGDADFVLAGDFNLTVSRGESGLPRRSRSGESKLLDRLESEFGVVSGWAAGNPNVRLPQTLRWAKDPAAPYHCDGVFIPVAWTPRLTGASVISDDAWVARSDHNPVLIVIDGSDEVASAGRA
jgi:endonuclease/exonuclease/phosphatase family metal-dependent hydrolase